MKAIEIPNTSRRQFIAAAGASTAAALFAPPTAVAEDHEGLPGGEASSALSGDGHRQE